MEKPIRYRNKTIRPLGAGMKAPSKKDSMLPEGFWDEEDMFSEDDIRWEQAGSEFKLQERRSNNEAIAYSPPSGGWTDE